MGQSETVDEPGFGDLIRHVEAARLLPFELLLSLMRHGKVTSEEASAIFEEMLAALPEELRDTHRAHLQAAVDAPPGS